MLEIATINECSPRSTFDLQFGGRNKQYGTTNRNVTFLFTDIEGSTRVWEEQPEAIQVALARHDEILLAAVTHHGGFQVKTTGDGLHAVFRSAQGISL